MDQALWEKCVQFHGHECPGLAIGFRASEVAMEKMGMKFRAESDEEIVCVTENDACGVDAVQVLTGCTLGKGNMVMRPSGKMAFSFFCRKSGDSIRLVMKPGKKEMSREERQQYILKAPAEDVFSIKKPGYEFPERARLFQTVICSKCGEGAPEHKIRLEDGKPVCLDCVTSYDSRW